MPPPPALPGGNRESPPESPHRAQAVRPGRQSNDSTIEELRALLKDPALDARAEHFETLHNRVKHNHAEVLARLDKQDAMLQRVLQSAHTHSMPEAKRISERISRTSHDLAAASRPPPLQHRKTRGGFTPKLFSTFTQFDLSLKEGAANVDADEAIKHKIRMSIMESHDSEEGRSCVRHVVGHPGFDLFFATVVLTNSVFIGIEVQENLSNDGENSILIQVLRNVYTFLFSVELVLRIAAYQREFFCGGEWKWNWLDLFIVLCSLWEAAVEVLRVVLENSDAMDSVAGLTGLRMARLIRITRVVRVAKLGRILRFVMALRTLIQSIIYTLKSLIWALVLLALIVYVFAVLFAQAVGDHLIDPTADPLPEAAVRYFDSLPIAMLSLFMSIAGGVSWEDVITPLIAMSPVWAFVFIFYVAFTYFAVLNVVTGVFCQSAIDSAQSDHTMVMQSILANKEAHIEKIRYLFSEIDAEDRGVITYQMFEEKVNDQAVKAYFESMDLDVWDAWSFFKLLDLDSGGAVEIEEFLMGCLRLRGSARAMDIAKIVHDQAWLIRNQSRFWTFVEVEMQALREQISNYAPMPVAGNSTVGDHP
ncbi:Cacna1c [Symbiodinium natans]|uniref:Cacna1c protein n=1 Tax=Symbiodinium natans TaxID=878477 RepID=A0A812S954_9DINO|nr:Cacna1c [Symbiodinium natans]